ncbi:MAG: envelope biogenesis factor ElyC, partial [Desulfobacterales bacterium]|nr:envelope biogenesis factor ElyC [Desulfobacterales bacterium]
DQSVDTKDQARLVRDTVGEEKFILVTSARHMARAFALFSKQGMNPVPAPVGMIVKEDGFGPTAYMPGAGSLMRTERAVYEYLGIAWAWLRGQV